MWARLKEWAGDLWGMSTTMVLAILVAAVPALQAIDPTLLPPWAKLAIALAGVAVAVLRVVAPPPPSIVVKKADEMVVDHATGSVTITKDEGVRGIADKPAGEPV